jgi:hypothetical protein
MKEVVMVQFEVLYRNLPGGIEGNHENLSQDSLCPGQDLNPGPSENQAGLLTWRD